VILMLGNTYVYLTFVLVMSRYVLFQSYDVTTPCPSMTPQSWDDALMKPTSEWSCVTVTRGVVYEIGPMGACLIFPTLHA
jgi:hypothetical protein